MVCSAPCKVHWIEFEWRLAQTETRFAKWSPTSRELLFVDPVTQSIKAAPYVVAGDAFQPGKVTNWSSTMIRQGGTLDPFAIHPDGKRLAGSAYANTDPENNVVLVFNFADYLHTIAPVKK